MTTAALILIAAVAFGGYLIYLRSMIAGDGHGRRAASDLPRSHEPDIFEPRQLV